jgi:hypothetical protein
MWPGGGPFGRLSRHPVAYIFYYPHIPGVSLYILLLMYFVCNNNELRTQSTT